MIKTADVKPGTRLVADDDFTCLTEGEVVTVVLDPHNNLLYVPCAGSDDGDNEGCDHGKPATQARNERHYLDGQQDEDEEGNETYVGFALAPPRAGDHVHHNPTGESWVVAYATSTHLAWCGWARGRSPAQRLHAD